MLPLPGVIAPWSVGRGHDKIVQLHKKESSQEAKPWPRNSMWPELDGGRIEPYILYDPKRNPTGHLYKPGILVRARKPRAENRSVWANT